MTETNWYSTPAAEEADADRADDNGSSAGGPDDLDISQSSWQVVRDDEAEEDEEMNEDEEMATTPAPADAEPAGEEEEAEKTDKVLVTEDEVEVEALVADERIDNPYIDDIEEETETGQDQPELTPEKREQQA